MLKKTYILYLIFVSILSAQSFTKNTVSLDVGTQPLRNVLEQINQQTGAEFIYLDELVEGIGITCRIDSQPLTTTLVAVLKNTDITYNRYGDRSYVLVRKKKPMVENVKTVLLEENDTEIKTSLSIVRPILLTENTLIYPPEAVKTNSSGNVKLKLLINPIGHVIKSFVDSSSGSFLLDSVSVNYSKNMKFSPALINGKARSIWLSMRFEFQIVQNQD